MTEFEQVGHLRTALPPSIGIGELSDAFESLFATSGTARREGVIELRPGAPALSDALGPLLRWVTERITEVDRELAFSKLWCVRSDAGSGAADRVPYVPHIDRDRYVKVMIYLDAVSEEDGPLTIAPGRPAQLEARRRRLGPDYKARGENVVTDVADAVAMTGPAGTVVLFDTNVPHLAGRVAPGRERRVLRFDFARRDWNRRSLRARLGAALRRSRAAGSSTP